jgi:hypothetical protein
MVYAFSNSYTVQGRWVDDHWTINWKIYVIEIVAEFEIELAFICVTNITNNLA